MSEESAKLLGAVGILGVVLLTLLDVDPKPFADFVTLQMIGMIPSLVVGSSIGVAVFKACEQLLPAGVAGVVAGLFTQIFTTIALT